MSSVSRDGKIAFGFTTGGVLLAAGFTAWALTEPVYSSGQTLLEVNTELGARLAVAAPVVVASLIWIVLHLACRRDSRVLRAIGVSAALMVLAFAYVAGFSFGAAVLPAAVALLVGALMTPVSRPAT
jgi:hypothetical protein